MQPFCMVAFHLPEPGSVSFTRPAKAQSSWVMPYRGADLLRAPGCRIFNAFPIMKYLLYTPSYHSLHHSRVHTNFCLFMPIYDYVYGTMDPKSDALHASSWEGGRMAGDAKPDVVRGMAISGFANKGFNRFQCWSRFTYPHRLATGVPGPWDRDAFRVPPAFHGPVRALPSALPSLLHGSRCYTRTCGWANGLT